MTKCQLLVFVGQFHISKQWWPHSKSLRDTYWTVASLPLERNEAMSQNCTGQEPAARETPALSFKSTADSDATALLAGRPCMKLTAESLCYSTHLLYRISQKASQTWRSRFLVADVHAVCISNKALLLSSHVHTPTVSPMSQAQPRIMERRAGLL